MIEGWTLICDGQFRRVHLHDSIPQCDGSRKKIRPELREAAEDEAHAQHQWALDILKGLNVYPTEITDTGTTPPQHDKNVEYHFNPDTEWVERHVTYTPWSQEQIDDDLERQQIDLELAYLETALSDMNDIINHAQATEVEKKLARGIKALIKTRREV